MARFPRYDGALLFGLMLAYTVFRIRQSRRETQAVAGENTQELGTGKIGRDGHWGVQVLLIAAAGLFRLADAVSRQHAATKAGTLGLGLILAGAALAGCDWAWAGRALTILAILFVTLPVASHMLARRGKATIRP